MLFATKTYQGGDSDPDRGALAIEGGAYGESYQTPEYLNQGWNETDSLWFYNTSQGSAILPYDFLIALEQPDLNYPKKDECERNNRSKAWFLCAKNIDRLRYLPQRATFFNPDALPVGFVKETYKGKDYVGFSCAACHTGQINFTNPGDQVAFALRIDGGPAMADMMGFLKELELGLEQSRQEPGRKSFVETVLSLNNDYTSARQIDDDLKKWTNVIKLYNVINNSTHRGKKFESGHARLDAFGSMYNRVLQHLINKSQLARVLESTRSAASRPLFTPQQIDNVLENIDETIIGDADFSLFLGRLVMPKPDYPGLSKTDLQRVLNEIFNPPNAPVNYPFLWDIAHSDYVQWNGLAANAGSGPIQRNVRKAIGAFSILEWSDRESLLSKITGFSLSGFVAGQTTKRKKVRFDSSIDLFNLKRLESHLRSLTSPRWPFCRDHKTGSYYLPDAAQKSAAEKSSRRCADGDSKFDRELWVEGSIIYADKCKSCHDLVDSRDWGRKVIANMSHLKLIGTDRTMAHNSLIYQGKSGPFKNTYHQTDVGNVVVAENAQVVELLTAAARGVIATPEPDKWWPRRIVEDVYTLEWEKAQQWIYTLLMSIVDIPIKPDIEWGKYNPIQPSIKRGTYIPDSTSSPYASLSAYKARSLNGIWATAPYLHNGSVPNLYELLLPHRRNDDVEGGRCNKYRQDSFVVGARAFDPIKVGFRSEGYDGFEFRTDIRGNRNTGHEFGSCKMSDAERWALIEYLKSL